jgi:hypothetical protein
MSGAGRAAKSLEAWFVHLAQKEGGSYEKESAQMTNIPLRPWETPSRIQLVLAREELDLLLQWFKHRVALMKCLAYVGQHHENAFKDLVVGEGGTYEKASLLMDQISAFPVAVRQSLVDQLVIAERVLQNDAEYKSPRS